MFFLGVAGWMMRLLHLHCLTSLVSFESTLHSLRFGFKMVRSVGVKLLGALGIALLVEIGGCNPKP